MLKPAKELRIFTLLYFLLHL